LPAPGARGSRRAVGNDELARDAGVGVSLRYQCEDLALARGECRERVAG
jgi:hypothetical protein